MLDRIGRTLDTSTACDRFLLLTFTMNDQPCALRLQHPQPKLGPWTDTWFSVPYFTSDAVSCQAQHRRRVVPPALRVREQVDDALHHPGAVPLQRSHGRTARAVSRRQTTAGACCCCHGDDVGATRLQDLPLLLVCACLAAASTARGVERRESCQC